MGVGHRVRLPTVVVARDNARALIPELINSGN